MIPGNGHVEDVTLLPAISPSTGAAAQSILRLHSGAIYTGKLTPASGDGPTLEVVGTASADNARETLTTALDGPFVDRQYQTLAIGDAIQAPTDSDLSPGTDSFLVTVAFRTNTVMAATIASDQELGGAGWSIRLDALGRLDGRYANGVDPIVFAALTNVLADNAWQIASLLVNQSTDIMYVADYLSPASVINGNQKPINPTTPGDMTNSERFVFGAGASATTVPDLKGLFLAIWKGAQLDSWDARRLYEHHLLIQGAWSGLLFASDVFERQG